MPVPLNEAKAELFRVLANPVRIRILELLSQRDHAVHEMLGAIAIERSALSQQLGVLRRAGIVRQQRTGGEVVYSLLAPGIADMLAGARATLAAQLADQAQLHAALEQEGAS